MSSESHHVQQARGNQTNVDLASPGPSVQACASPPEGSPSSSPGPQSPIAWIAELDGMFGIDPSKLDLKLISLFCFT
eukprot:64483-Pelagomonas_calceolata.AAC.1